MNNDLIATPEELEDLRFERQEGSTEITTLKESETFSSEEDMVQDYNKIRSAYHESLEIGINTLKKLEKIASEAESPRMFEVLSTLIGTIAMTGSRLKDLHKPIKDKSDPGAPLDGEGKVTNNFMFTGSTKELSDFMKDYKTKS